MGLFNKMRNLTGAVPTCRQAVKATVLPRLMMPGVTVAVRVDPTDHSRIALSLGEEPPTVTMASSGDPNTSSASRITPGNTVHAKRMPDGDDREVVIDWEAALAQGSTTAA